MRIFTLSLAVFTWQTLAQEAVLERIEVTAQKRPESLQRIPVSVTAISSDQIDTYSLEDALSIASVVPNMSSTRAISGMSNYFIRGIGLDDFNLSSVPAIGLYLDEVAIHNPMLANFALHDIERVEVLRGPQNALYGKNTTGGAVHFISTKTQNDYKNGYIKLTAGAHEQVFLDVASNVEFSANSVARFSGFVHKQKGQIKSTVVGNNSEFGNIDRRGFKVHFNSTLYSDWQLSGAIYTGIQRQIAEVKTVLVASDNGMIDISKADLDVNGSELINPRNNIDALGGYLKLTYEGDSYDFSSLTSIEYGQSERMDDWGAQGTPASVFQSITYNSSDTAFLSQEFQWSSNDNSPIKWLAGLAINKAHGDLLQTAYIDPAGPGRPDDQIDDAGIGPLFDRGALVKDDSQTYSIYGQLQMPIVNQWSLTSAYRWTRQHLTPQIHAVGMMMDNKEQPFPLGSFGWFSVGNPNFNVYSDYAGFKVAKQFVEENGEYPAVAKINETFNEWGGKISVNYQASSSALLYGSMARGFKMGTVNSNPTTAAFSSMLSRVVEPESLITYELGVKSQWLNDALRINVAVFENHWRDYQFYMVYNPGNPVDLFATLVNLPKAKSTGAEIEVNWLIDHDIAFTLGIGWLETKVLNGHLDTDGVPEENANAFQQQVIAGNKLTNSPEWDINAALHKTFDFQGNEFSLALHYNYIDEHIHILAGMHSDKWRYNFSEQPIQLFGLSGHYRFGEQEQFQATLWARNITDEQYCLERAVIPGTDAETVRGCVQGQGRQLGFTFKYLFD